MQPIKDVVASVLQGLHSPEKIQQTRLASEWPQIIGGKIAAHTRPMLGRNETLWVWVDQSTLAFEISQKYRETLLKRAQASLGEEAVKAIRIRVGQLR